MLVANLSSALKSTAKSTVKATRDISRLVGILGLMYNLRKSNGGFCCLSFVSLVAQQIPIFTFTLK